MSLTHKTHSYLDRCGSQYDISLPCLQHLAIRNLNFQKFCSKITEQPEAEEEK